MSNGILIALWLLVRTEHSRSGNAADSSYPVASAVSSAVRSKKKSKLKMGDWLLQGAYYSSSHYRPGCAMMWSIKRVSSLYLFELFIDAKLYKKIIQRENRRGGSKSSREAIRFKFAGCLCNFLNVTPYSIFHQQGGFIARLLMNWDGNMIANDK